MASDSVSAEEVYGETCTSIRSTDDISFKLMGLVPLLSGATMLALFNQHPIGPEKAGVVVMLSLFAALITLGLFRWELRNIQTCKWLRSRVVALEKTVVNAAAAPNQPKSPLNIGKTEAEKWIYFITITSWLIVPKIVLQPNSWSQFFLVHFAFSIGIAAFTLLSVLVPVRIE